MKGFWKWCECEGTLKGNSFFTTESQRRRGTHRGAGFFVLGLLLILAAGCGPTEADKKALRDAYSSYGAREFAQTEVLAGMYIQNEPTAENVDEAFYLRGLARYGHGDRVGAAADLEKAVAVSKRADLKFKAYFTLGDIAFDQFKWDEATDDYQKALGFASGAKSDVRIDYRLGVALQGIGQWDSARPYFQAVIAANGDEVLVERARARIEMSAFSLQFGAFGQGTRAGELAKQLKSAGINTTVGSELHDKQLVFVVRWGSFGTWAEAEAARGHMAVKYPQVTVVP